MPTYEYRCGGCNREFETFQRMSDPPVAPCPYCDETAERLISGGAGLLFRGEGFYITDYRSEEYRKKASEERGAGGSAKGDSGSKGGSGAEAGSNGAAQTKGGAKSDAGPKSRKSAAAEAKGAKGAKGKGGRTKARDAS